jgi:hypothetical protein
VLVLVAMLAVKNGWVLRRAGLIGSCVVHANLAGGLQQEACKAGTLDGNPDLSGKGCTVQSRSGSVEYWVCPAPIRSSPAGV